MAERKGEAKPQGAAVPSLAELKGRQSVRATFRLSGKAIETLSVAAAHMGIKQKSLFDHLIDDAESLAMLAREIEFKRFLSLKRIQKTFVLSRRTLGCLEAASKDFDTPRDALVEYSIARLMPVIQEERKKHAKRKAFLRELEDYLDRGETLVREMDQALGADDVLSERLRMALSGLRGAYEVSAEFVEKGSVIETF